MRAVSLPPIKTRYRLVSFAVLVLLFCSSSLHSVIKVPKLHLNILWFGVPFIIRGILDRGIHMLRN